MSNISIVKGEEVSIGVTNQVAGSISISQPASASISIAGIVGGGGDLYFVHEQGSPASVWYVEHNLSKKPSVTVVSSTDAVVYGVVEYIDNNNVKLTFESGAFSGKAYFN